MFDLICIHFQMSKIVPLKMKEEVVIGREHRGLLGVLLMAHLLTLVMVTQVNSLCGSSPSCTLKICALFCM